MPEGPFVSRLKELVAQHAKVDPGLIQQRSTDSFMKNLGDVRWRPDYVFEETGNNELFAVSIIYDTESFPYVLARHITKAKRKVSFQFFFVLEKQNLLGMFEEDCRRKGFGLILRKNEKPLLVLLPRKRAMPRKRLPAHAGHFTKWLIRDIGKIQLGNPKFRKALRSFSKAYAKLKRNRKLNTENEEGLVIRTIKEILESDNNYTSGVDSLTLLRRFEGFAKDIRDHYFHSFHIFLLGLLILDYYKDEFTRYYQNVFPKYEGFSPEFLWLLTSIFHDVGYPIAKLNDLKQEFYGVPTVASEKELGAVWDDQTYKDNLRQLISLFKFSLSSEKHRIDWPPEVWGGGDDQLEKIFRESLYDCHGVAGCFRFLVDICREAKLEPDHEKKLFLVNHVYPAALSITLHDRLFRQRLSDFGITSIKLSRFPFAVLLGYLDSLQEDKRDNTYLCLETPALLKGFEFNGKVLALFDRALALRYPRLAKMKVECKDFLDFVEFDGIEFRYPKVLLV